LGFKSDEQCNIVEITEYVPKDGDPSKIFCFVKPDNRTTALQQPTILVGDDDDEKIRNFATKTLLEWTSLSTTVHVEFMLEEIFHLYGLKMRDLYNVLATIYTKQKQDILQPWAQRIKMEIIARAFHKIVKLNLRQQQTEPKVVLSSHFNALLFNPTYQYLGLWNEMNGWCRTHYGGMPDVRDSDLVNAYPLLIRRASELLGVMAT